MNVCPKCRERVGTDTDDAITLFSKIARHQEQECVWKKFDEMSIRLPEAVFNNQVLGLFPEPDDDVVDAFRYFAQVQKAQQWWDFFFSHRVYCVGTTKEWRALAQTLEYPHTHNFRIAVDTDSLRGLSTRHCTVVLLESFGYDTRTLDEYMHVLQPLLMRDGPHARLYYSRDIEKAFERKTLPARADAPGSPLHSRLYPKAGSASRFYGG